MPLMADVEKWLRDNRIPYIAVNEAKKALFAGSKLKSFHFVVYRPSGCNWLVCCGERTQDNLADLSQWQAIFGDGFRSVFAVKRKLGFEFRTLDGEPMTGEEAGGLPDQTQEAPPALQNAVPEPRELNSPSSHPTLTEIEAPRGFDEVLGTAQATLF